MSRLRLLVPLTVVLVLLGCANPGPSVAAKVGDVVISESEVSKVTKSCSPIAKGLGRKFRTQVVEILIRGEEAKQIAANSGIKLSQQALDQILANFPDAKKVPTGCVRALHAVVAFKIVSMKLGFETPTEAKKIHIQLNPRYGKWDGQKFAISGSGAIADPLDLVSRLRRIS